MSRHTPGPWDTAPWGDGSNLKGCTNVVDHTRQIIIATDVQEGYARLIAAAPDLLEALEDLINKHKAGPVTKAKAAIAKAQGVA